MYRFSAHNRTKEQQTARADKYPQGYFKDKPCKECGEYFTPNAPSELYCSDVCKDIGITTAYLRRSYGITYHDYVLMLKKQNGRCAICAGEGFIMGKHHKLKLVVDHCHKTGKVRGLLCHNCNRALGLLQDNAAILRKAAEYVSE